MHTSWQTIFNNSATSRQPPNRTRVKIFYFKMKNMLMDFSASFNNEIKQYPETNQMMALMKKT